MPDASIDLRAHLDALLGCRSQRAAGELLLARLGETVTRALRPDAPDLMLLNALLYLRGEPPTVLCGREARARRPSMSMWRRVQAAGEAVALDVLAGGVPVGAAEPPTGQDAWSPSSSWVTRQTTHALAWPLRAPGAGLTGMVCLELQTEADGDALHRALLGARDEGQRWADLSAAALLLLPREGLPRPPILDDQLVIGPELEPILHDLVAFAELDDAVILLTGPTGAGKTTLARWCHERSPQRCGPLVVARLHERPEGLHAAALFGWSRGAFTDARGDGPGWLGEAQGGTLFIDEIDKLSLQAQALLLGVLDRGAWCRVGESHERTSDARVIVGTNADLDAAVREGRFLRDLYYRVNVLPVRLPPLRERPGEIGPQADAALRRAARGAEVVLSDEARALLQQQPWPGNLRELGSVVTRAYAFARASRPSRGPLVVGVEAVRRALALDAAPPALLQAMESAATAFLAELERRNRGPRPLDLDHTEALRGLVLRQAVARHGLKEAYALVGQHHAVEQNNQHKLYQRQLARVEALEQALREG